LAFYRKFHCFALLGLVLSVAHASTLSLNLLQPNITAPAGSTQIFKGTITNNTGAALDAATDIFLNFENFDPTALTPIQLLGTPDFTIPEGTTSALVDLFSLVVDGALPQGEISSIDVVLEDGNGDLSSPATEMVTTGSGGVTTPEPATGLVTMLVLMALLLGRRRLSTTLSCLAAISCLALAPAASAQSPSFSTQTPTTASSSGAFTVVLPLANTGAVPASGMQLTFAGLTSAGAPVSVLQRPTPLPLSIGPLAPGAVQLLDLAFDSSVLVAGKAYLLTVRGTYSFNGATLGFSVNRPVVYSGSSPFGGQGNPIAVTPNLDTANMVTQMAYASVGATLTTTGTDGTVFTLTIPAHALLSDELITMTPLSSLSGIPLTGGLVAAVQLEPDDLLLLQPATLTIQPTVSVPIQNQVAFGYRAGGQDFSLSSLGNTTTMTLGLTHFSGHGVGTGSPFLTISPVQAQAKLESLIAPLLQQQRTCVLAGTGCDPQFDSKLDGLEQMYFDQVVVPLMQQALTDYTVASSSIGTALSWLRQVVIANPADGLKEPFLTDQDYIMQTIPKILKNGFQQIYGLCIATSDASQRQDYAVQLLGIARQLDIMFGGALQYLPNYKNQITACAVGPLDLSFDSQVKETHTQSTLYGDESSHVLAPAVHLTPDLAANYSASAAPLQYLSFTITGPYCSIVSSTNPGTLVASGNFDLNLFLSPQPPTLVLTLRPNIDETVNYGEQIVDTCTMIGPAPTAFYTANLLIAHSPDFAISYRVTVNSTQTFNFNGTRPLGDSAVSNAAETSTITLNQSNP
jgi:hypothetical protein